MLYSIVLVSTVQQSESAITIFIFTLFWISFPFRSPRVALMVKNLPANAGDTRDLGSIPGSGRLPGGGNGNTLQYPCLGNPMDTGVWCAVVHGVAKNEIQLSTQTRNPEYQ